MTSPPPPTIPPGVGVGQVWTLIDGYLRCPGRAPVAYPAAPLFPDPWPDAFYPDETYPGAP